jgi:hypothetical protein
MRRPHPRPRTCAVTFSVRVSRQSQVAQACCIVYISSGSSATLTVVYVASCCTHTGVFPDLDRVTRSDIVAAGVVVVARGFVQGVVVEMRGGKERRRKV